MPPIPRRNRKRVLYTDNDPFVCEWTSNLILEGLIPDGEVLCKPIQEISRADVEERIQCHFFNGLSGWPFALRISGWQPDRPVVTGSCPCQPFSSAGRRKGTADERHLWPEFMRVIGIINPSVVFGEQVSGGDGYKWLSGVRLDLEGAGYAFGAADLPAGGHSAPHARQRLFWGAGRLGNPFGSRTHSHTTRGPSWQTTGQRGGYGDPEWVGNPHPPGPQGLWGSIREGSVNRASGREITQTGDADNGMAESSERGRHQQRGAVGRQDETGRKVNAQQPAHGGGTGGMGDTHTRGRSEVEGFPRRTATGTIVPVSSDGPWSNFQLVACTDGKARRVEPGTCPLAARIPRKLGPLLAVLERMGVDPKVARRVVRNARGRLAKAGRNRTGRLQGYGNSIVPWVASSFVTAFSESLTQLQITDIPDPVTLK